ncbi:unnamed protein product [Calypogeia fissa]
MNQQPPLEFDFGCYNGHFDVDAGTQLAEDEMRAALAHLKKFRKTVLEGCNVEKLLGDSRVIAGRIAFMKERGVILNTMDLNPSRDSLMQWINQSIIPRLGVNFIQVKVLARSHYLLMMNSSADRLRFLATTPLYMDSRLVVALPWEPTLDATNLATRFVPLWVDLVDVHPVLEMYATQMMERVGKVVYSTIQTAMSGYMNIQGCVLCDIQKPQTHFVEFEVPDVGSQLVEVVYKSGPEHCPICTNSGHLPFDCPLRPHASPIAHKSKTQPCNRPMDGTQSKAATAHKDPFIDDDGFQLVTRKHKGKVKVGLQDLAQAMDVSPIRSDGGDRFQSGNSQVGTTKHTVEDPIVKEAMEAQIVKQVVEDQTTNKAAENGSPIFQDAHTSSLSGHSGEGSSKGASPKSPDLQKIIFDDELQSKDCSTNEEFVERSGSGSASPTTGKRFSARSLYNDTSTDSGTQHMGACEESDHSNGKRFSATEVMEHSSSSESHIKVGRKASASPSQDTASPPLARVTRQTSRLAKKHRGRDTPSPPEINLALSPAIESQSCASPVLTQSAILTPIFKPPVYSSPLGSTPSPSLAPDPNPDFEWAARPDFFMVPSLMGALAINDKAVPPVQTSLPTNSVHALKAIARKSTTLTTLPSSCLE